MDLQTKRNPNAYLGLQKAIDTQLFRAGFVLSTKSQHHLPLTLDDGKKSTEPEKRILSVVYTSLINCQWEGT